MIISQRKFILHKDQSSIWRIVFFQMLLLFFFHSCTKESNPNLIEKKKIDSLYQKAAKHVNEGKDEKAFYEFNLAKDGYLNNKDSIWAARCLTEMAIIQEYSGDNLGSIETGIAAIKLLHENEKDHYELLFDNYINELQGVVIVRALVSEAPLQIIKNVPTAKAIEIISLFIYYPY